MNNTDKWLFYDHFWPFFCQLLGNLSQNWGSDGHFEVLYGSTSWLVQTYGFSCRGRPCTCLANSQKIATDKWPFYDHIWPFFANYIFIFHKTEVRTIILKCITSLNPNWFKSYDTKTQKCKKRKWVFLYKIAKNWKWKYLLFGS